MVSFSYSPNTSHDTITILRFLAITLIVFAHFGVFDYGGGGAALLLMIVGYNFSKFKFHKVIKHESVKPIVGMIIKVIVPTVGFLLLLQVYHGSLKLDTLFLYSNFGEDRHPMGFEYWFIEVYVQIQLIMLLIFSSAFMRNAASQYTQLFIFSLIIFSTASFLVADMLWDTSNLFRRLPHMLLWIFAMGFAAHRVEGLKGRLLLTVLFIVVSSLYYGAEITFFNIFALGVIWNPEIKLPRPIMNPISKVATASLFIYLTHFQIKSALEKVVPDQPILYAVVALVGGYLICRTYQFAQRELIRSFPPRFSLQGVPLEKTVKEVD